MHLKKGQKMKTNFFKANINEAELNELLENELDEETTHKFLKILNDEKFSLVKGELNSYAWTFDSNERFFCDIIRKYKNREYLFDDEKANEMIDEFSRKYNINLYKNASRDTKKIIFVKKMCVWNEYARFLRDFAWWCLIKNLHCRLDLTQEQNQLLDEISTICAEYDAHTYKLNYDKTIYKLNDERIDMIELIEKSAHLLSEIEKTLTSISVDELLSELDKKNRSLNIHELLELAKSLLEKNQKNEIFIDNDINLEYLLKNNLFYRSPAIQKQEIF